MTLRRSTQNQQPRPLRLAGWTIALLVILVPAAGAQNNGQSWIGTWATAPVLLPPPKTRTTLDLGAEPMLIQGQSLRQIVHTSLGGAAVRVALTNLFGDGPLEIGSAHVALRRDGATIEPAAAGALQFDGRASVTIAAGATVLSDPVPLQVPALADLAIDIYLPDDLSGATATYHSAALTTSYLSSDGNHVAATHFPVERTFQNWFFLSRVEVLAPSDTSVIVTLGDSITDGTASTPDTNSRWPNFLARRLAIRGNTPAAVLNVGIAGNRVLNDNAGLGIFRRDQNVAASQLPSPNALFGPSALSRLERDVFEQPGVTHMVVLESTNDIGMAFDSASPTVEQLIAGHTQLVERAHARGLKVYGGTLVPFGGAFYFRDIGETKRQAFNEWMRNSGVYDAVIDFDAAMRDSSQPSRFIEAYQSGDWLHPSDEGYRVMAEAIDLTLFAR